MEHCCRRMTEELERSCPHHETRAACPDSLVEYIAKFDEYGLIVHDGTSSIVTIAFCPWCGVQLPPSRRDQWVSEMERRGIDPWQDPIPEPFQDDAWYRAAGGSGASQ